MDKILDMELLEKYFNVKIILIKLIMQLKELY